jgi:hypothetical protein
VDIASNKKDEEDNMSKYIKLSELKEKKLKEEEMKNARGGVTLLYAVIPPDVLHYGIVPDPW